MFGPHQPLHREAEALSVRPRGWRVAGR